MNRPVVLMVVAGLSFAAPAAAKPPIAWVNGPVFPKSGAPPARTAFVVHGPVRVSTFRDEFAKAFASDTTAGQAAFAAALAACMSGARVIGEPSAGLLRDERHRVGWTEIPADGVRGAIAWADSADSTTVFANADSLAAVLARAGADWLVVIDGLVAEYEAGEPGHVAFVAPGQAPMVTGGTTPVVRLTAHVAVVHGALPIVAGSGKVSAWRAIGRFRKSSVDGIAESFTLELERALGRR